MRRSYDDPYSGLKIQNEKRDIATAGAVDLKIKQDLFAKDIAYDGKSETINSKLSERDKGTLSKTLTHGAEDEDDKYRKTLENFNLVKPNPSKLTNEQMTEIVESRTYGKSQQKWMQTQKPKTSSRT